MPIFILMTRLAPDDLFGPYDAMDIDGAPDVETAHQVSLISRAEGALNAENWPDIPYEKQLELLASIEG